MPNRIGQIQAILYRIDETGNIKYLLLKRNPQRGGFWQAVTGGIEPGEVAEQTVRREIFEELGIENKTATDLQYSFTFTASSGKVLTEHVFSVDLSDGTPFTLSPEHTEYKWMSLEEALDILKYDTNKKAFRHCHSIVTS